MFDIVALPDVVIALSGTDSAWIPADGVYADAREIGIIAPGVLAETVTIQVNTKSDGSGTTATLQANNVAVKGPLVSAAEFYTIPFKAFRIHLSTGAAVAHTFGMVKRCALGGSGY